jgi:indole-3-glycerol phosphate synthase
LSQAIAEGDGITVIAHVTTLDEAVEAAARGADAIAVSSAIPGLREKTSLPILWRGEPNWEAARSNGADACVVYADEPSGEGLELVAFVANEQQLAEALEYADPEIFMLGVAPDWTADFEQAFQAVLDLLHDVPAGKLAIAEVGDATAADVAELERAGVDAVLVTAHDVAALVPAEPPEV